MVCTKFHVEIRGKLVKMACQVPWWVECVVHNYHIHVHVNKTTQSSDIGNKIYVLYMYTLHRQLKSI